MAAGRTIWTSAVATLVALMTLVMLAGAAVALDPSERLADPALESRARELSAKLRCLVCQNQSIDDSNAPLAKDLRLLVRERLQTGESNDKVLSYIVARYGDFVLLTPPFKISTLLLWIAPLLGLLAIGTALIRVSGMWPGRPAGAMAGPAGESDGAGGGTLAPAPLTREEEARLRRLLGDDGAKRP